MLVGFDWKMKLGFGGFSDSDLKNFGAALEPTPQGFEENEKLREPLGETVIQRGDLCSYGGFGGHDIQDKNTLKVRLGEGDIREEGS